MTNLVCGLLAVGLVDPASTVCRRGGRTCPGAMLVLRGCQPKVVPLPHVHPSRPAGATASRGGRSPVLAEREASSTQVPGEEGVLVASYLRTMDDKIRRGAPGKPPVTLTARGPSQVVHFSTGLDTYRPNGGAPRTESWTTAQDDTRHAGCRFALAEQLSLASRQRSALVTTSREGQPGSLRVAFVGHRKSWFLGRPSNIRVTRGTPCCYGLLAPQLAPGSDLPP